jgi:predicted RNA-binding Zn ribbon-like protein
MPKDNSAPGVLEFLRGFVNSLDPDRPQDDPFRGRELAGAWLRSQSIEVAIRDDELEPARELRELLRGAMLEHTEGEPGHAGAALLRRLDGAAVRISFVRGDQLAIVPLPGGGYDALRGVVAGAVYEAQLRGTWPRLKACRKHACHFAFYDRSKNGSGAWCSMEGCGNRVKAERRRARERAIHSD